jgi:transcriptional regulator with XRE-family HTH domain
MENLHRQIGDAIKLRRNQLGLSQQALAERTALRRATISKAENGQPITVDVLLKICNALKGSVVLRFE